jgi:hypothetical protein
MLVTLSSPSMPKSKSQLQYEFFQEHFPVIEEKNGASFISEYIEAHNEHGPLLSQALVAGALKVSRQRVHQLVEKGRIAIIEVGGHRFVPAAVLNLFLTHYRRGERPTEITA